MNVIRKALQNSRKRFRRFLSVSDAEFLPEVIEIIEKPPSPLGRLTVYSIVVLALVVLVWSLVGEVDEVAVAPGKIVPAGRVSAIQAEDKGTVRQVLVRDGQEVSAGQVLIELERVFTAADLDKLKKDQLSYLLEIARLSAEKSGGAFFPPAGVSAASQEYGRQQQMFESRLREYLGKLAAAEALVRQSEAHARISLVNRTKLQEQLLIAAEKEKRIDQLYSQNAVAFFQVLDYRSKRMELEKELAVQEEEVLRQLAVLQQNRTALQQVSAERMRDIDAKLVENSRALAGVDEELKKADLKNRYNALVSPVSGRVSQLSVHNAGAIVTPAQLLMNIVPAGTKLVAEAWVANKDIGFIWTGQQAEVKVETFNFQKYGTLAGQVVQISPDAEPDKDKNPVYRIEVELKERITAASGAVMELRPGMTVSVEMKTRRKRLIEFFLDPFQKTGSEALRER